MYRGYEVLWIEEDREKEFNRRDNCDGTYMHR